jgi:hypothetical protein
MIPLTLTPGVQRGQVTCYFDFLFMGFSITAVGREVDNRQAWAHFDQCFAAEKETAVS